MDEDGKIAFIPIKRKEHACGTRAIINLGYVLRVMNERTGHRTQGLLILWTPQNKPKK